MLQPRLFLLSLRKSNKVILCRVYDMHIMVQDWVQTKISQVVVLEKWLNLAIETALI